MGIAGTLTKLITKPLVTAWTNALTIVYQKLEISTFASGLRTSGQAGLAVAKYPISVARTAASWMDKSSGSRSQTKNTANSLGRGKRPLSAIFATAVFGSFVLRNGLRVRQRSVALGLIGGILAQIVPDVGHADEKCWKGHAILQGKVEMEEQIHPNDTKFKAYFLRLAQPICYIGYDSEAMKSVRRTESARVQIWQTGDKAPIRQYVGKSVEVEGNLFEPQGGYARAYVAIQDSAVRLIEHASRNENVGKHHQERPADLDEYVLYCLAFLETEGVLKRLGGLYKPNPAEPQEMLLALYFVSGPAYDRINLQPGKIDRVRMLRRSIVDAAPGLSSEALLSVYNNCRKGLRQ